MSNWAQRGKEALATVKVVPEGMKRIGGGGEEISVFYRFTIPTTPNPKCGVLEAGTTLLGAYAGSYENKKFGNTVHKLRTDKGLVALPNATQLNNALKGIVEGTQIAVTYNGKKVIKTGKFAGKQAHTFEVYSA